MARRKPPDNPDQFGLLFDAPPPPPPVVLTLPVSPARNTDPETAHEAAKRDDPIRGAQRLAVLRYYERCGMETGATDFEAGEALGILRTSAGKRRKELCEAGLIRNSGKRRDTDTGSSAIVWVVTYIAVRVA